MATTTSQWPPPITTLFIMNQVEGPCNTTNDIAVNAVRDTTHIQYSK